MQPNFRWSFGALPIHQHPSTSSEKGTLKAPRSKSYESFQTMQAPRHQALLTKISALSEHAKDIWGQLPLNSDHQIPESATDSPNTDDDLTEKRLSRLEHARQYFENMQWQDHPSKRPDQIVAVTDVAHSKVPAIRIQTSIAAHPNTVFPYMLNHISDYKDWLPVIKDIKILEQPSQYEHIIAIETRGKLGFGSRFALAYATFDMRHGCTQVLLEQLPSQDERYEKYAPGRKNLLNHFESFMQFTPNPNNPQQTDLLYHNHTDPNIALAPKKVVLGESLENNQSFVEKCSTKLVDSQQQI